MTKGIPLTEAEQLQRRREIARASVALFLAQGFPETSMREIAAAAGMGKSSLYDYFTTKDDILLFLIEDIATTLTEGARVIAGSNLPPDDCLRQIMEMQLDYLQANDNLFWLLNAQAQRLKPESQQRLHMQRYVFQDLVATPAWTPLFAQAAAVVTDIGGPLSHSSIVAREYGIPAVMAAGSATRAIQSGQIVTVDGTAGTVTIEA
jgi:AcrR family transcriptional regulator